MEGQTSGSNTILHAEGNHGVKSQLGRRVRSYRAVVEKHFKMHPAGELPACGSCWVLKAERKLLVFSLCLLVPSLLGAARAVDCLAFGCAALAVSSDAAPGILRKLLC